MLLLASFPVGQAPSATGIDIRHFEIWARLQEAKELERRVRPPSPKFFYSDVSSGESTPCSSRPPSPEIADTSAAALAALSLDSPPSELGAPAISSQPDPASSSRARSSSRPRRPISRLISLDDATPALEAAVKQSKSSK